MTSAVSHLLSDFPVVFGAVVSFRLELLLETFLFLAQFCV